MENFIKFTTPLRSGFSKIEKRLSALMKTEIDDPESIHVILALFEDKWKQLDVHYKQIIEIMENTEYVSQESFVKEIESMEWHNDKYIV